MANILYPTRAGDHTYRNQDRVIDLVREREAGLILLYVSNVRFLDRMSSPVRVDLVKSQLDEMGEFLLAMAQERAEKKGVKAETLVRHGNFVEVVRAVIKEHQVDLVVLGRPSTETAITTTEYISKVAQSLATDSGIEVWVIDEGEIVDRYLPARDANELQ